VQVTPATAADSGSCHVDLVLDAPEGTPILQN
jgi:hypothetical protein